MSKFIPLPGSTICGIPYVSYDVKNNIITFPSLAAAEALNTLVLDGNVKFTNGKPADLDAALRGFKRGDDSKML